MLRRCSKISFPYEHITNGTENSVALLTSTEKSGQPWLLLLLHYHGNTTLIWKTYFGTAPNSAPRLPLPDRRILIRDLPRYGKAALARRTGNADHQTTLCSLA